ncbi:MAG: NAD(+)/NADH kinase [Methanomassiliicoccaceae archaeon]|jgi:NAD+ kinase|nr:NAD(+)/NADH kinase [Methanomassiliicoccaceae archaeon]
MMMNILSEIACRIRNAIALIPDAETRGKEICVGRDGTPTTHIDKIAENIVLAYLQEKNIPLNVLSEEIGFVDNGAEETLVLDPIDGTTNSVIGVPLYTVSMAIGKTALRDVHTAFVENLVTGDRYTAEKGKGAYLNGNRIHAKKRSVHDSMMMMIYLGNGAHPDSFALAKRMKSSRAYGCASIEMALVATGAADGFLMNAENNRRSIRVIDIAASYLLVKEAGGEIYNLDGTEFDMPFDLDHRSNFLAVGNRDVYDLVMFGPHGLAKKHKHRYGIYANMSIPISVGVTRRVLNALAGEDVILESEIAAALGKEGPAIGEMDVDILITVGGDGTILRAMQRNNASIFGVNAGGVGFLAEIPVDGIEEGIARLRDGRYRVDERLKLQTVFNGKRMADAVNEAVIHTDSVAKIRQFRVYVDGRLATDLRADGVIISTPTGSTCYAMSVGSPIIDPRVNALVMVPMAAFKFAARPIVIPTSSKITVELAMDKGCLLVVDGQEEYPIPGSSRLEFTMSSNYGRFIRFDDDFYSRIHEKLESGL